MNITRFDIAIAGDSLAARMVAALLAKHGKLVLLLATAVQRDPWQQSSLFSERLIDLLGGRDAMAGHRPLQVLSERARVTISPDCPFDYELKREFGPEANSLRVLFDELERSGTLLEELFWEYGGLPSGGIRHTLAWRWLCLRRKLPLTRLARPLPERLRGFPEPAAAWLRDLFQGLSLRPLASLTVADAALLWANVRCPGGYDGELLDRLLRKRFEQFHGVELAIDTLTGLEHSHGQWRGILPDGRRFLAGQFILGDLGLSLPGHGPLPVQQCCAPPGHFTTTPLDGQISALLESQVIVGGSLPVRMSLISTPGGLVGTIGSGPGSAAENVSSQLQPFLPFARYTLRGTMIASPDSGRPGATTPPALFKLPLQLGNHLWCADDTRLLPHLGNGGAALLAWTLARRIDPTIVVHAD